MQNMEIDVNWKPANRFLWGPDPKSLICKMVDGYTVDNH
ncbi:hypothetical protein LSH36_163g00010, partial [Paralvinella palmiformis]